MDAFVSIVRVGITPLLASASASAHGSIDVNLGPRPQYNFTLKDTKPRPEQRVIPISSAGHGTVSRGHRRPIRVPLAVSGAVAGDVTSSGATVWSRADEEATMRVSVHECGSSLSGENVRGEVAVDNASDFTGQVRGPVGCGEVLWSAVCGGAGHTGREVDIRVSNTCLGLPNLIRTTFAIASACRLRERWSMCVPSVYRAVIMV